MSYILEALKKAQAERQLGAVPTLYAPTLHDSDGASSGVAGKKPVWLALVVMALVIVVLLVLVMRRAPPPPSLPAAAQAPVPAPAVAVAPQLPVAPPKVAAPAPARVAAAPAVPAAIVTPPVPSSAPAAAAPPVHAVVPPAPPAAAASAQDDSSQTVRDLPEPIQRALPQVAIGGYIYSRDPADRLLLIDKVLRHEGEEVASGLVLEKLLPKAAIFSFRGYRYRMPY